MCFDSEQEAKREKGGGEALYKFVCMNKKSRLSSKVEDRLLEKGMHWVVFHRIAARKQVSYKMRRHVTRK